MCTNHLVHQDCSISVALDTKVVSQNSNFHFASTRRETRHLDTKSLTAFSLEQLSCIRRRRKWQDEHNVIYMELLAHLSNFTTFSQTWISLSKKLFTSQHNQGWKPWIYLHFYVFLDNMKPKYFLINNFKWRFQKIPSDEEFQMLFIWIFPQICLKVDVTCGLKKLHGSSTSDRSGLQTGQTRLSSFSSVAVMSAEGHFMFSCWKK